MVVPPLGLDLDVLSDHVEAHFLDHLDVPLERFLRGGRVEAVRPPALVQNAVLEDVLVVQLQPLHPVHVGSHGDLAHGRVAPHPVHGLVRPFGNDRVVQENFHVVEERVVRRPKQGLMALDEFHFHRVVGGSGRESDELAAREDFDEEAVVPLEDLLPHDGRHRHRRVVNVWKDPHLLDVGLLGDALEPDGLPDAGVWGVPHPERRHDTLAGEGVAALLAPGLDAVVGGVENAEDHLLLRLA
mmetsp:Transcript_4048/g.10334  ORF Transcript_4048/g.10334 Transcript_4048/m.10334 type:complete len:242 (+) Transcript_4048:1021-1746(+)